MDIYKIIENICNVVDRGRNVILLIIFFVYVGYFTKIGYDIYITSFLPPMQRIIYGIILVVMMLVVLFISHFSGGYDNNLKYIVVLIGLASGGAIIGLIGGAFQSLFGWISARIAGAIIIMLSIKYYNKIRVAQKSK